MKRINNAIKDYLMWYKENIGKLNILFYIVFLLIVFFSINLAMSSSNVSTTINNLVDGEVKEEIVKNSVMGLIFKEKILVAVIPILLGMVPFCFLPVLSIIYPYVLGMNMGKLFLNNGVNMTSSIVVILGVVFEVFALSLSMSTGIYICRCITNKIRSKKINKEAITLKINYKFITISSVISLISIVIGTIISKI